MDVRTCRVLLLSGLALPLIVTLSLSPWDVPSTAVLSAQVQNRLIGPNAPIIVDTNGDGLPTTGDQQIVPTRQGNVLTIASPWDCNGADADNRLNLAAPNGQGRFTRVDRVMDGGIQSARITQMTPGGAPTAFEFQQMGTLVKAHTASIALTDDNQDGIFEAAQGADNSGGAVRNFSLSFVQTDVTRDGKPDYISVPWSQADLLGVDGDNPCGPSPNAQVWIPLADTNDDGNPDGIGFDLDGNMVPDADLVQAQAIAQPIGRTGYIGPNFPILIDTSGDGRPTPGVDLGIIPSLAGAQLTINSPWDANTGDNDNRLLMSNPNGAGKYQTIGRTADSGALQQLTLGDFQNGSPTLFTFAQSGARTAGGNGRLIDSNGDGLFDGVLGKEDGGAVRFSLNFVHADTTGDGKPDYVSVPWSQAGLIGVDRDDAIGPGGVDPQIWVPLADTNDDGTPDAVGFDLNGDGIPDPQFFQGPALAGSSVVYALSESATGSFFDSYLLLANPHNAPASVELEFLPESGSPITSVLSLAPFERRTIKEDDIPGLEANNFGTRVTTLDGETIGIERAMYFNSYKAGHVSGADGPPAQRWYFADGAVNLGFETYLLLSNARSQAANVTLTFLLEDAAPITHQLTVGPEARVTFGASSIPGLAGRNFAVIVDSTEPVHAERAMYLLGDANAAFRGGHASPGSRLVSNTWYHPEGSTGVYFDTYLLLANPSDEAAQVSVTYRRSSGAPVVKSHTIAPRRRLSIYVDAEDPQLADAGSVFITLTSSQPIVSERSMYWSSGGGSWTEGHNSPGIADPDVKWLFAEGALGGPVGFETYLLLGNPGSTDANVTLTYLLSTGSTIQRTTTVPAGRRIEIAANTEPTLNNEGFGTLVQVTNGVPIVAERSLYWRFGGSTLIGGTSHIGTRLP